ncbi:tol-pal system YbgF family protein [Phycisphaerales bacterium AB-hyl4]|uniref:Tol-pal system YbgF family protein n=1 Tax=Natronomicrosphaera hydrolytica TaxID=3242702 RepID=A0ABV4U6N7_9BACT
MEESPPQPARRRGGDRPEPNWSQVWQLPLLLLGAGLFVLGIWLVIPDKEAFDHQAELDEAQKFLTANNLESAEKQLRWVEEHLAEADRDAQARFWHYWGDLRYLDMHDRYDRPADTPTWRQTNETILRAYERTEEYGRELDGESLRRYAETLVMLGREQDALKIVDRIDRHQARQRYRIVRQLIERHRETARQSDPAYLAPLMDRFEDEIRHEADDERKRAQEIWISRVRAEIRMEAEDYDGVVTFLLRRIQRLDRDPSQTEQLAPLRVVLAQAYHALGRYGQAEQYFNLAQQQLPAHDPLQAEVLVGMGQLTLADGPRDGRRDEGHRHVEQAHEYFSAATTQFPTAPAYIDALIGQADCEARMEAYADAVDHFRLAVEQLHRTTPSWDSRRLEVVEVVRSHIDRLTEQQRYEQSLDFLTLLVPLHEREMPADLLLDFALTHEHLAEQRHAEAQPRDDDGQRRRGMTVEARRLANQEAATHFTHAANYYLRHARSVTITDDYSHGQSLWRAAQNFDRAQQWGEAINTYAEFIQTRQQDPLRLRAINHLGKAYLADGQYSPAIDLFLELINDHPRSPEAYDSLVPLARSYIGAQQHDAAERTLLTVVTDHEAISPETNEYRHALIELGRLYYRMGADDGDHYIAAIERLEEAVERYGHTDHSPTLRYLLADAYRKSIERLEEEIQSRQVQRDRVDLQHERDRRLQAAQKFYNQVITELEDRPEGTLTASERLYLRNAYFYQADCAYDREQYEAAISLYDAAARRWEEHPASLMALVQIVNAHCELGQFQEARVANERARAQLDRIPDDAFDDPTLPMSRQHWEDWLRWTSEVNLSQATR